MIVLAFLVAALIFLAICKLSRDWPRLIVLLKEEDQFLRKREPCFKAEIAQPIQKFVPQRKAPTILKPGGWKVEQEDGYGPPWYSYSEGGQSKTAIRGSEMYETIFTSIGKR